jgi:prephenate dehydratase
VTGPGARVAFQGAPGAFSEEAVRACFGADVEPVPCREFADVTRAVATGTTDLGMLPVENTLAGSVIAAYDALVRGDVQVIAEVVLPIRHFLMAPRGSDLGVLRSARSHPVALAQCSRFFAEHPRIRALAAYDTAGGAQEVAAAGDPVNGAIASRSAARRYDLEILAADIQDRDDNATRFLAITRADAASPLPGADGRCILVAETDNRPGALLDLLTPFARSGINLTKLESRPGVEPWTYRFIIELEGASGAERAIAEARTAARSLRTLGVFSRTIVTTAPG